MFCHYQAIPADWPRNSLLRLFYYRASSWTGCETGMQSLDTAITGLSRQLSQHRKKVRDEAAKKYGSGSSDVGDSSAAGREGTSREARSSPEEPTNASYNARGELITGISFDLEYELDDLNSPSWVSISNIQI